MNDTLSPLVSVVIPSYNHGRFLGRALQSVLDQTYTNSEVIVIDNHSTDNTDAVMASFADPRITYLKLHNNGIIAASRNAGLRLAKGEWIAFLDSDDYWIRNKLEQCILNCSNNDVIYHRLMCYKALDSGYVKEDGVLDCRDITNNPHHNLLKYGPSLTTSGIIVKKNCLMALSGFDESINIVGGEDYDLWLRLAGNNCKFKFINSYLGYYLINGNHVTSAEKSLKIITYLNKKHFELFLYGCPDWAHKSMLASYIKMQRYTEAKNYGYKVVSSLPFIRVINIFRLLIRAVVLRRVFSIRAIS